MGEDKTYYRRHLPHYQPSDAVFFVTFRLAESIPKNVLKALVDDPMEKGRLLMKGMHGRCRGELPKKYVDGYTAFLEKAKNGPHWLNNPAVAGLVAKEIHNLDDKLYSLIAYTIMPNHVHMVVDLREFEPKSDPQGDTQNNRFRLTRILRLLKGRTSRGANQLLGRSGNFWHHESYDHVVRSGQELRRIIDYVLYNAVAAGLANSPEDWKWSYVRKGYR
jgi:REP element-mobilizing transposase RayT